MSQVIEAEACSNRILAVEDDADAQCNLRDILELDGYQFEAVSTLREATQKRNLSDFFAIVLDRKLPDGLAEDSLPMLRGSAPHAGILIVTGCADLDATIAALRHGIDDYILKPIDSDALRASLIRVRKLRQTARPANPIRTPGRHRPDGLRDRPRKPELPTKDFGRC